MSYFSDTIMRNKYAQTKENGEKENWNEIAWRVAYEVTKDLVPEEVTKEIYRTIRDKKFIPGGRYLYAAGRPKRYINNCFLLRADDSKEGWADLLWKLTMCLTTGGGVGTVYSDVRAEGSYINGLGGTATGPIALMKMANEVGRGIQQGGSRRAAQWAGLHWNHNDIFKFIELKNWSEDIKRMKEKDFNFPAPMDGTNISVILDNAFFAAMENEEDPMHQWAKDVYWKVVYQMCSTGEPGFSVDCGENEGENLRNALSV